jgi:hypothetical protein
VGAGAGLAIGVARVSVRSVTDGGALGGSGRYRAENTAPTNIRSPRPKIKYSFGILLGQPNILNFSRTLNIDYLLRKGTPQRETQGYSM